MSLTELKAWELRDKINAREVKVLEVIDAYLQKIQEQDPDINAYVYLNPELARERALKLDQDGWQELKAPGLPIAIKDNICVRGEPTTCCSRILENFLPPYNATVIERLQQEGVILLGKTNMDEFAFGSSSETSCYGPTKNPYDPTRVPGGSSGGSAAAVGAKEALWALGSDTGGSIRQPAALCGVVGLKPTYGRVSRFGLIAFASSLDQIGPITRDVKDAALLLEIIAGYDSKDSTSSPQPVPSYYQNLKPELKGLKIGVPKEYFGEGIDSEIREKIESYLEEIQKLGAKVKWISLPHTEYAVSCYYIIAPSEASSNLARYDGVQYGLRAKRQSSSAESVTNPMVRMYLETRSQGFGPEAKRRIILGTYSLSSGYYQAYYLRAARVRTLIKEDFLEAFKECDCLISPTSPTPAFKIGEKTSDPLQMYLSDIFTIPANLAGIPAISIPIGFTKENLPIGMQIMANYFQEQKLLNIAFALERMWNE